MRVNSTPGNPWDPHPSAVGTAVSKEATALLVHASKETVKKEMSTTMAWIQNGPMLLKTFNFLACAIALAVSTFQVCGLRRTPACSSGLERTCSYRLLVWLVGHTSADQQKLP